MSVNTISIDAAIADMGTLIRKATCAKEDLCLDLNASHAQVCIESSELNGLLVAIAKLIRLSLDQTQRIKASTWLTHTTRAKLWLQIFAESKASISSQPNDNQEYAYAHDAFEALRIQAMIVALPATLAEFSCTKTTLRISIAFELLSNNLEHVDEHVSR